MGLQPPPAPVDMTEWRTLPHMERIRPLVVRWGEYGADSPPGILVFYLIKIVAYIGGAIAIIGVTTPGLGGIANFPEWWSEPIVYQKMIVYTMVFEILGLGGGSGPLTFRFLPPVTAFLHFLRPGTIRQPPWPGKVPFTRGDDRTVFDVLLYIATVGAMVVALVSSGSTEHFPGSSAGTLEARVVIPYLVLLGLMGLRDKAIYLAARAEMYWVASFVFLFPPIDMIMGFKVALCAIWFGAGISKLTPNFPFAVAPMISNSPLRPKLMKRVMYRDFPNDMLPSKFAWFLAHVGTVFELGGPIALLTLDGDALKIAVVLMVIFHLHIISTIPMGVPNEWNVFMMYATLVLFWAHGDVGFGSIEHPWLLVALVTVLLGPVVIGNIWPEKVSFLTSMRYYAANWANGAWVFRNGSLAKLQGNIVRCSGTFPEQLEKIYDKDFAELAAFRFLAFRAMHPHGRGQNGLFARTFQNLDDYFVIDGEAVQASVMGWNFGDGHLHDEQLLAAVQRRCNFEPGELTLVYLESQPLHRQRQAYRVVDAATGELEAGYISMHDQTTRQPWMEGPAHTIPVEVIRRSVPNNQPYLQSSVRS